MSAVGIEVIVPLVPLPFVVVRPLVPEEAGMPAESRGFGEGRFREDVLLAEEGEEGGIRRRLTCCGLSYQITP